jgi:molybdate transport system regulatory protein
MAGMREGDVDVPPVPARHHQLKLRVLLADEIAMGPGKADLLEAISATGSISAAARAMGMSYRRAWLLVAAMNACFRCPLVEARKGGGHGGGATLTAFGWEALGRYRLMERQANAAIAAGLADFRLLLADAPGQPAIEPGHGASVTPRQA